MLFCLTGNLNASDSALATRAPEGSLQSLKWQEEVRSGFIDRMLAGGGELSEKAEQLEKDRWTLLKMVCESGYNFKLLKSKIASTVVVPTLDQESLRVLRADNIEFKDQLRQAQNEKNQLLRQLGLPQEGHSMADLLDVHSEFVPSYNNLGYIKGLEDAILAKRAERSQIMGNLIFMDDAALLDQVFVILEQEKRCLISIIGYQTELNCLLRRKLKAMTEIDPIDAVLDESEVVILKQENIQLFGKIERLKCQIAQLLQSLGGSATAGAAMASATGEPEYPPLPGSDEDKASFDLPVTVVSANPAFNYSSASLERLVFGDVKTANPVVYKMLKGHSFLRFPTDEIKIAALPNGKNLILADINSLSSDRANSRSLILYLLESDQKSLRFLAKDICVDFNLVSVFASQQGVLIFVNTPEGNLLIKFLPYDGRPAIVFIAGKSIADKINLKDVKEVLANVNTIHGTSVGLLLKGDTANQELIGSVVNTELDGSPFKYYSLHTLRDLDLVD